MFILGLLPLIALASIFLLVLGCLRLETKPQADPIHALMVSLPLWGAILTAITEGLSLFHAVSRPGLVVSWLAVTAIVLRWAWKAGSLRRGWMAVRFALRVERGVDRWVLGGIALLALGVLVVALVAPPNTIDVLQYHMPRVVHWAQQGSLDHFATNNYGQVVKPIWAEVAILNLRVLWGDDRPAGLVQWMAMLASAAGAAGIAALLGGNRRAQWVAAAFAISVPVGFLQAPTAMNDYASAWWVVSLAYFVVLSSTRKLTALEFVALSAAVGLGMLTKGTFFPYAGPLLAWFGLAGLRRRGLRRVVVEGLVGMVIVAALNAGFWYRNIVTFGDPYGGAAAVASGTSALPAQDMGNEAASASMSADGSGTLSRVDANPAARPEAAVAGILDQVAGRIAKLARMLAMNLVTPIGRPNRVLFDLMRTAPEVYPSGYIEGLELAQWNNEMTAGNPLHLGLLVITFAGILLAPRLRKPPTSLLLILTAVVAYALVSQISYSDWIYGIRYQLAFFLLGAPLVGVAAASLGQRLAGVLALGLVLYAVPYLLFSNMRPVIGRTPWPTRIESIFVTDPAVILFAQSPEIRDEYEAFVSHITDSGCRKVGVSLNEGDPEYTWWWLMRAPQSGMRIEARTAFTGPDRYLDSAFEECAVLCTHCQGGLVVEDLPLMEDAGHVQLFMRPGH